MEQGEAKRIGSLGGKAKWAKLTPEERKARMNAIRRVKKVV